MYRKMYEKLLEWKNKPNAKPLLLLGARQVGKTYLIEEFCNKEYKKVYGINLLKSKSIVDMYKLPIDSKEKFNNLKANLDLEFDKNTILFIDEIQESEELISDLKYIYETYPNNRIICSGSLLGIAMKRMNCPFPVGKVTIEYLYPMNFEEFLIAFNQKTLINLIKESFNTNKPLSETFHNIALDYYRKFLITGGMPENVNDFVKNDGDLVKLDKNILNDIEISYIEDMARYIETPSENLKIRRIYESIPMQLKEQNKSFYMSNIEKNAKRENYMTSMDWLINSSLILQSFYVKLPEKPLEGMKDIDDFKFYYNDIGLLIRKLGISNQDILTNDLGLYKGAVVENYVATELKTIGNKLYFWKNSATAEIDFLIENKDGIIPIEVKASDNTKAKSLKIYMDKYHPKYAIRISTKNFGFVNDIKSVPLYAVFCLEKKD